MIFQLMAIWRDEVKLWMYEWKALVEDRKQVQVVVYTLSKCLGLEEFQIFSDFGYLHMPT